MPNPIGSLITPRYVIEASAIDGWMGDMMDSIPIPLLPKRTMR